MLLSTEPRLRHGSLSGAEGRGFPRFITFDIEGLLHNSRFAFPLLTFSPEVAAFKLSGTFNSDPVKCVFANRKSNYVGNVPVRHQNSVFHILTNLLRRDIWFA